MLYHIRLPRFGYGWASAGPAGAHLYPNLGDRIWVSFGTPRPGQVPRDPARTHPQLGQSMQTTFLITALYKRAPNAPGPRTKGFMTYSPPKALVWEDLWVEAPEATTTKGKTTKPHKTQEKQKHTQQTKNKPTQPKDNPKHQRFKYFLSRGFEICGFQCFSFKT